MAWLPLAMPGREEIKVVPSNTSHIIEHVKSSKFPGLSLTPMLRIISSQNLGYTAGSLLCLDWSKTSHVTGRKDLYWTGIASQFLTVICVIYTDHVQLYGTRCFSEVVFQCCPCFK